MSSEKIPSTKPNQSLNTPTGSDSQPDNSEPDNIFETKRADYNPDGVSVVDSSETSVNAYVSSDTIDSMLIYGNDDAEATGFGI
jgi:hypothetical protein